MPGVGRPTLVRREIIELRAGRKKPHRKTQELPKSILEKLGFLYKVESQDRMSGLPTNQMGPLKPQAYNVAMQKFSLFLSHVTVESTLADALRKHLARDFIGLVDVFVSSDRLSIPAGKKWLSEVTQALQRADLHLILCSKEATLRPWIQFEAGAAHLRGIPIIPLCHSGLTNAQLPVPLSEYESVQLSELEGLIALYQSIANLLGSSIPEIDFQAFTKEIGSFEAEYAKQRSLVYCNS